jgi:hypothetical protein
MKVIPPITITDAMLVSCTVPEPDASAGEAAWVATTNYSVGQKVVRSTTHRVYQNQMGGVDASPPESAAPGRWLDIGPTNRWALFDTSRNSACTAANSITVVLALGKRANSAALMGLVGESASISMTSGGPTVYSTAQNLILRKTLTWSDYFFGTFSYQGSCVRFDLPQFSNGIISITVSRVSGNVSIGAIVLGQSVDLGTVLTQARSDALNFSTVTRDAFGNATLVPRRTVPKTDQTLFTTPDRVDKLREVRNTLNAVPAVWCGMDDKAANPNFEALLILGVYKEFSITLSPAVVNVTLSLEEI